MVRAKIRDYNIHISRNKIAIGGCWPSRMVTGKCMILILLVCKLAQNQHFILVSGLGDSAINFIASCTDLVCHFLNCFLTLSL